DVRHPAFRALTGLRTRIVRYWRSLTLPYVEPGIRLIRQSEIEEFDRTMKKLRSDLVEAVVGLEAVYDEIKSNAQNRLGRLYSDEDFPSEARGRFDVQWDFPPTEPPDYLMRLNPELYRQEQQRVARRFDEAVRLAEQAFIEEFAKLVAHLASRL